MTMFTVISNLKSDTGLVSSIAWSCCRSKSQLVFCINTELSPVVHGVAGGNPCLIQGDGLVSKDKEAIVDTFPAILVQPKHVGDFLQSHSLWQIIVLHQSSYHLVEICKVASPLEL